MTIVTARKIDLKNVDSTGIYTAFRTAPQFYHHLIQRILLITTLLALFLTAAVSSAAPVTLNGTFAPDQANKEMPRNWTQNKGEWFKPYGTVKYLGPNRLQVITNDQKSVYVDESTRFPVAPGGSESEPESRRERESRILSTSV